MGLQTPFSAIRFRSSLNSCHLGYQSLPIGTERYRRSRTSSPFDAGPKGLGNRHGPVVLCDRAHGCLVSRSQEQLGVLLVLLVFSKVFSIVSRLADILNPLGRINGVARPNQKDKDRH